MADRFVLVSMTLSDRERRDVRGSTFQADLLNNAHTVCTRTTKFGRITRVWEGRISRGSAMPHRKRAELQRSSILGVLRYLCAHG